ncbi:LysR family transcriptional regulator [Acaricomes phytoseiuli]|uniref:LysR family transcriptional regulator n=1 Tax=Acaricomes phytoseiuli TaxID=291968 RepID=UPI000360DC93|nr:LysR family transcriptional regulator [Acaricomes phytoseiuli]MCW1250402.1 LysR family transcriptional regulator [Acaricomes phytoseiuli]
MDVHQLKLLRELGELGSVTAVAETLYVTPSAVSQQLAQLQRQVDVPLTRKQGRSLVLTEAGRALAEASLEVMQAMARARAAVEGHLDAPSGTVTVSPFHSAGQALFGVLLQKLQQHPGLELRLADEDVAESDFPALTGRYDLVLAHRMSHSEDWASSNISVTALAEEPFDIVLPTEHPLASRTSLRPQDVAGEAWVTSRAGFSPDDVLSAIAVLADQPVRVAHRVNDYAAVAAIVAHGGGVLGLLPRLLGTANLPSGLVLRPLEGIHTRRRIDLLSRPENLARRSVQLVAQALQDVLSELQENLPIVSELPGKP